MARSPGREQIASLSAQAANQGSTTKGQAPQDSDAPPRPLWGRGAGERGHGTVPSIEPKSCVGDPSYNETSLTHRITLSRFERFHNGSWADIGVRSPIPDHPTFAARKLAEDPMVGSKNESPAATDPVPIAENARDSGRGDAGSFVRRSVGSWSASSERKGQGRAPSPPPLSPTWGEGERYRTLAASSRHIRLRRGWAM